MSSADPPTICVSLAKLPHPSVPWPPQKQNGSGTTLQGWQGSRQDNGECCRTACVTRPLPVPSLLRAGRGEVGGCLGAGGPQGGPWAGSSGTSPDDRGGLLDKGLSGPGQMSRSKIKAGTEGHGNNSAIVSMRTDTQRACDTRVPTLSAQPSHSAPTPPPPLRFLIFNLQVPIHPFPLPFCPCLQPLTSVLLTFLPELSTLDSPSFTTSHEAHTGPKPAFCRRPHRPPGASGPAFLPLLQAPVSSVPTDLGVGVER